MKSFLKISLLLLWSVFTQAQKHEFFPEPTNSQADSMQIVLSFHSTDDSMRMLISRSLGFYYLERKFDSALYFFLRELHIAQQLKLKLWESDAFMLIGYTKYIIQDYPGSLNAQLSALKIAESAESEKNIWSINTFTKDKSPHSARLFELSLIHLQMGHLHRVAGNTQKGISEYLESLKYIENNEPTMLYFNYLSLGGAYVALNKLDSALLFEQMALDYSYKSNYKKYQAEIFKWIANIYLAKSIYDSAKKYLYQEIQTSQKQNNLHNLTWGYFLLTSLYLNVEKNKDSSLFYAKKNISLLSSMGSDDSVGHAYLYLARSYQLNGNTDSANKYQTLALTNIDSSNQAKIKSLAEFQNRSAQVQLHGQELEREKEQTQSRIRMYAMVASLGVFLTIGLILYRNNRHKQKANRVLESTLTNLKSTQSQLIQSEKMASLGELTAGIAHEIQNPLNFVNNFSEVSTELIDEMQEEMAKGNGQLANEIANDLKQNLEKINHHGKRAGDIVKGMLQHSRTSTGQKELTDINALCDEYLRLSYHGLRAKDKSFNAEFKTDFDSSLPKINIVPQDIGRVILNLINNAFYAASQNPPPDGGGRGAVPTIWVSTKKENSNIMISIKDNGPGIPKEILDKIFQPFFTTKPTGQGTGLGLSLSYDIVKAHGGEIKVETKEGEGSEFVIQLSMK